MSPLEIQHHFLFDEEEPVDRRSQVRVRRAIARDGREPRLLVQGPGLDERMARLLRRHTRTPGVPLFRAFWPASARVDSGLAVAYAPGVSFTSLLTQTRGQDARMPPEAVAVLFADAARALTAYGDEAELEPLSTAHIRVCFDGSGQVFPIPAAASFDDIIGLIDYEAAIRAVELGPALGPATVDDAATRAQDAAWHVASLMFLALGGQYPSSNSPLEFLSELRGQPLRPPPDDTPRELAAIYTHASTSVRTWEELLDVAERLEAFGPLDVGRRALGGCAGALFPEMKKAQLQFVEEAAFFDVTESHAAPAPQPPEVRVRERVRLRNLRLYFDTYAVTHGDFARFLGATGHPKPQSFLDIPELAEQPVILVSHDDAAAYAAWAGGRLPTEEEWVALAWDIRARDTTRLWEWTSTPMKSGHVVRGGPWRNRTGPGAIDHRSWEDGAAPDVGFRVVYDSLR